MRKILLAGALVVFAGVGAVAMAADHKGSKHAAPAHASVIAPASKGAHKAPAKKHATHKAHAHKHHSAK
jgi:hypothetical protein